MRELMQVILGECQTFPCSRNATSSGTTAAAPHHHLLPTAPATAYAAPVAGGCLSLPEAVTLTHSPTTSPSAEGTRPTARKKNSLLVPCVPKADAIDWRAVEIFRRFCLPAMEEAVQLRSTEQGATATTPPTNSFLSLQYLKCQIYHWITLELSKEDDLVRSSDMLGHSRAVCAWLETAFRQWKGAMEVEEATPRMDAVDAAPSCITVNKSLFLDHHAPSPSGCHAASRALLEAQDGAKRAYSARLMTTLQEVHQGFLQEKNEGENSSAVKVLLEVRIKQLTHCLQSLVAESLTVYRSVFEATFLTHVVNQTEWVGGGGGIGRRRIGDDCVSSSSCLGTPPTAQQSTSTGEGESAEAMWVEMGKERAFATRVLHHSTVLPYMVEILSSRLSLVPGFLTGKLMRFIRDRSPDIGTLYGVCNTTKELEATFVKEFKACIMAEVKAAVEGEVSTQTTAACGKLNHRVMEISTEFQHLIKQYTNDSQVLRTALKTAIVSGIQQFCPQAPRDSAALITFYLKKVLLQVAVFEGDDRNNGRVAIGACGSSNVSLLVNYRDKLSQLLLKSNRTRLCSGSPLVLVDCLLDCCTYVAAAVDASSLADEFKQLMVRRILGGGSQLLPQTSPFTTKKTNAVAAEVVVAAEFMFADFVAKHFGQGKAHHLQMLCGDLQSTHQLQGFLDDMMQQQPTESMREATSTAPPAPTTTVRVLNVVSTPNLMIRPLCSLLKASAETVALVYGQMFPKRQLHWVPTLTQVSVLWRHSTGQATVVLSALHLEILEFLLLPSSPPTAGGGGIRYLQGLGLNDSALEKHVAELIAAGLLVTTPSSSGSLLDAVFVAESHSTTCSLSQRPIVVGQPKKDTPTTHSLSSSSSPRSSHKRRILLDSMLVRLLKREGTVRFPLASYLQPLMNSAGAGGPPLTKTEVDACVDRLCQREYACLEACGERVSYVA